MEYGERPEAGVDEMKAGKMPLANRLQAVETSLDSLAQKHPDIRELARTLHYVRSVQRELFGPRYVREHSLLRFNQSEARLKKKSNWAKVERERAIQQNGKLKVTVKG